jgi:transposase
MIQREYPDDIRLRAIELVRSGITRKDIATQLGVPYGTVQYWCRDIKREKKTTLKLGPWRPNKGTAVAPEAVKDAARQMRRDGMSIPEIARRLRLSETAVGNWCAYIEPRPKPAPGPNVAGPCIYRGLLYPGGRGGRRRGAP